MPRTDRGIEYRVRRIDEQLDEILHVAPAAKAEFFTRCAWFAKQNPTAPIESIMNEAAVNGGLNPDAAKQKRGR